MKSELTTEWEKVGKWKLIFWVSRLDNGKSWKESGPSFLLICQCVFYYGRTGTQRKRIFSHAASSIGEVTLRNFLNPICKLFRYGINLFFRLERLFSTYHHCMIANPILNIVGAIQPFGGTLIFLNVTFNSQKGWKSWWTLFSVTRYFISESLKGKTRVFFSGVGRVNTRAS